MKSYVLPVVVRAFHIAKIEGFKSFPIRLFSEPEPTPGGLRMVYSTDDNDAPVCVDSSFISQIKPGQHGLYVEYPDGHAVFWELDAFMETFGAEKLNGGMSFSTALSLARRGTKIYRKGWAMDGIYLVVAPIDNTSGKPETLMMVYESGDYLDAGTRKPWVPGQNDLFRNDWSVYEVKAK
ncbi:TPA: DUF2829 domain-containing protein [Enterobacter hormaechei subsp. xiangfangensis]|nr:DUF2829 domain-containing protein [Enterobacter hormaechei subsp. xiangfangensis]HAV1890646.1 DUF2829 domain-containing protein [Enterobacter hormaechei subsp. xiangfangensis]